MLYLMVGNIFPLYEKNIFSVYPSKWLKLSSLKPSEEILGRKKDIFGCNLIEVKLVIFPVLIVTAFSVMFVLTQKYNITQNGF